MRELVTGIALMFLLAFFTFAPMVVEWDNEKPAE